VWKARLIVSRFYGITKLGRAWKPSHGPLGLTQFWWFERGKSWCGFLRALINFGRLLNPPLMLRRSPLSVSKCSPSKCRRSPTSIWRADFFLPCLRLFLGLGGHKTSGFLFWGDDPDVILSVKMIWNDTIPDCGWCHFKSFSQLAATLTIAKINRQIYKGKRYKWLERQNWLMQKKLQGCVLN
jgi:hypothetical protein